MDVLRGSPFGGCAILWRRDKRAQVSTVATDCSRIYVLQVRFNDIKLLLINAYLQFQE